MNQRTHLYLFIFVLAALFTALAFVVNFLLTKNFTFFGIGWIFILIGIFTMIIWARMLRGNGGN